MTVVTFTLLLALLLIRGASTTLDVAAQLHPDTCSAEGAETGPSSCGCSSVSRDGEELKDRGMPREEAGEGNRKGAES